MEILESFFADFLAPAVGDAHLGLYLLVCLTAVFPLAPPEEAFTLLGGACIAGGILHPFWGSAAVLGGIISVNSGLYWMGRGGLKLLSGTRIGNRIVNSLEFKQARKTMYRRGIWAIVGCRFFFGTRTPTYLAAGFFRYRFPKFLLIDGITVVLHGILFLLIGYWCSDQIDGIVHFMERMGIWSLVLLLLIIAAFFGAHHWMIKRRRSEWEDAT
ncbi:MAG: hypothetical protein JXR96_03865 [Deltaproteobacteria bacterium]|nr:hypothetical protein [Deltaproteobacteria bacterium]